MEGKRLICVDCYEKLERITLPQLNMLYCNNIKCRRFGVLTIGGLFGERCEKSLVIEDEKGIGKEK